ncbi:MAG TPA: ABC transporter ATP-binding protein [Marinagarivorans sp.]
MEAKMNSDCIVRASNVNKNYGTHQALKNVNFTIEPGRIVGLIGPNGAGKTTLLKGLLGLAPVDGELDVLGFNPAKQRTQLIEHVSFIADTAIMPRWIKVCQALDYVAGVHPRFNREKAQYFLDKTSIKTKSRISSLSKGMITQLHLALVMAIDSRLLVLDEPTLGLDIVYRKQFYNALLSDYFDEQKTIVITTHQVEEIENILTDLMFINKGELVLDLPMDAIGERFTELSVNNTQKQAVQQAGLVPINLQQRLGGVNMLFENVPREALAPFGQVRTPTVADLFVAKVSPAGHNVNGMEV